MLGDVKEALEALNGIYRTLNSFRGLTKKKIKKVPSHLCGIRHFSLHLDIHRTLFLLLRQPKCLFCGRMNVTDQFWIFNQ